MYGSIGVDREIRIRVEKEISISTCRNGYAAVNRPVAPPPPHKYSIKFIRTNISSRREILSRSIRPRFIRPMTDSASSSLRYPTRSRFPNRSNSIRSIPFFLYESLPLTPPLDPSNPNPSFGRIGKKERDEPIKYKFLDRIYKIVISCSESTSRSIDFKF